MPSAARTHGRNSASFIVACLFGAQPVCFSAHCIVLALYVCCWPAYALSVATKQRASLVALCNRPHGFADLAEHLQLLRKLLRATKKQISKLFRTENRCTLCAGTDGPRKARKVP